MSPDPLEGGLFLALKVGELYATMRLDNKGFDTALDKSGAKFQSLGSAIGKGTQAAARVFAATTVAAAGLGVAALKVGLDYNRMQQTSRAALLTLLGSTEAVNAQMAKLDEFASKSPFSKQVFLQAQQQMLGFGIEAQKVVPYLDAIQNAVASVGGSNQDISEIVNIFSKIQGASKITAQNLNELGYRGLDAATIIGDSMGKTANEIRAEITAGTLDAGVALDALAQGMTTKFGGATDRIKEQMDGAADRVKAAWRDIGSVMATPLIDPTSGGQLVEWTNLFADGLRQIQKQAVPVTDIIWGRLSPGVDLVTSGMKQANAAIAGWDSSRLESSLDQISKYAPLVAGTSAALFAMGTSNLPILSALGISGINPVVAGLVALVAASPQLRQVGRDFLQALQPAIQPAMELARIIGDFLMAALDALSPALGDLVVAGADVGVVFLQTLVPGVRLFADLALPVVGVVADLVSGFAKLPTPVLAGVAAFAALKHLGIGPLLSNSIAGGLHAVKAGAETAGLQLLYARDGAKGMRAAMQPLASSITGVGTALKGAFLANAPLIAVTALITAITFFSQKAAEAEARAAAYGDVLREMGGDADKAAEGIARVAAEAAISGDNMDWGWYQKATAGFDSLADALDAAGSSATEFGEAVTGTQEDADAYINSLWGMVGVNGITQGTIDEIRIKLGQQRTALGDAEHSAKQLADVQSDAAGMSEDYARSLQDAADAADRLRKAEQDLAAAKGDLVMSQYAADDALKAWVDRVGEAGGVTRNLDGELNRSGAGWRAFEEGAIGSRNALQRMVENLQRTGASQDELNGAIATAKDRFLENAVAIGISREEAEAYWDTLDGIPEIVSTKVEADTLQARSDLEAVLTEIQRSTGVLTIDANQDPAVAQLAEALGLVDNGEGIFTIDARNDAAMAMLALSLFDVDTATGIMSIDAENPDAIKKLLETIAQIDRSEGTVGILGKDLTKQLLASVVSNINSQSGYVKVYATDNTWTSVSNIIAGINSRSAYIQVRTVAAGGHTMGRQQAADGGIFNVSKGIQSFGSGGMRLPSQATIQAGSGSGLIQWAEGETGGEGFVPLALAKRARSLQVMRQIASMFGYVMVPNWGRSYADGGVNGASMKGHGAHPGGVTNNFYDYSTTYYPVAEPKSVEQQRRSQRIGAGVGGLG